MKIRYKFIIIVFAFLAFVSIGVMTEYRRQIPMQVITRYVEHQLANPEHAKFLVFGDFGTGDENQKHVAELLENLCVTQSPDALLLLGDNFYNEGVQSTDDSQWQTTFEKVYSSPCLKQLKAYAVLGNHDYKGKPHAQIAYTQLQSRWVMPARYYKVSFGNFIDIFAVDTVFSEKCWLKSFCSVDWMRDAIGKSHASWRIAIGHYPLLSVGGYKQPKKSFAKNYADAFCRPQIQAYFAGHDHSLQHLKGIPNYGTCPIEQFISAGGGGTLQKVDADGAAFAKSTFGVMMADIKKDVMDVSFFEVGNLKPIYSYTVRREE